MKGQGTVKYLLGVSLSVIVLCGSLSAGPSFLDDFGDGNVQDGSPVNWGWEDDGQGERLVTGDGFRIKPNPGEYPWACILDRQGDPAVYAGSMTIRAQFKMDAYSSGAHAGIWFRLDDGGNYYLVGIVYNELFLSWSGNREWQFFQRRQIPGYNAAQHDIIVQVDVTDFIDSAGSRMSRLEVRGWMPDQDKPAQPQISVVDGKYDAGAICLYAYQSPATFRQVEVVVDPVVDFSGDGTVDVQDLLKMIRCWGQDEPSVDLNGDGTVDKNDLEILMDYWGQDVNDPTLLAHWALDEAAGDIACDSAGRNDAVLLGGPVWNPSAGQIDGALGLDGQDDCVVTDLVCNPADGPFSVLAWIQAGTPGQVLVSQAAGSDWLSADPLEGNLMTAVRSPGQQATVLCSETAITDGEWHRVGLTWDGTHRGLYVDDKLVAEDTQSGLEDCFGGLNIGCGADMTPGTFFSGLIDDVRIYDRAVKP